GVLRPLRLYLPRTLPCRLAGAFLLSLAFPLPLFLLLPQPALNILLNLGEPGFVRILREASVQFADRAFEITTRLRAHSRCEVSLNVLLTLLVMDPVPQRREEGRGRVLSSSLSQEEFGGLPMH